MKQFGEQITRCTKKVIFPLNHHSMQLGGEALRFGGKLRSLGGSFPPAPRPPLDIEPDIVSFKVVITKKESLPENRGMCSVILNYLEI